MIQRSTHFALLLAVAEDRSFNSDKLSRGMDVDRRTTSSVATAGCTLRRDDFPSIRLCAKCMSSKPMTERSSGTFNRASNAVCIAPLAVMSFETHATTCSSAIASLASASPKACESSQKTTRSGRARWPFLQPNPGSSKANWIIFWTENFRTPHLEFQNPSQRAQRDSRQTTSMTRTSSSSATALET